MQPSSDIQALENLWRERVKRARMAYLEARSRSREIELEHLPGTMPPPDGAFAILQALRAEYAALVEYRRKTKIYSNLVSGGVAPPQSESDE